MTDKQTSRAASRLARVRTRVIPILGAVGLFAALGLSADAAPPPVTWANAMPLLEQSAASATNDRAIFVAVTPTRVLDTRIPIGVNEIKKFQPGETKTFKLAGTDLVPANATSVSINTTLDFDSTARTFITVFPTGVTRPNASSNNTGPGLVQSNSMNARVGTNGSVDIYNHNGEVHVIIDVVGYFLPNEESPMLAVATLMGEGAPAETLGVDGNGYIDFNEFEMYGPKRDGEWGVPREVADGAMPGFLVGEGAPMAAKGDVGDSYFDQTARTIYGPKTTSGWGLPIDLRGADGATIISGSGAPGSGVGSVGDIYIDVLSGVLHGPKTGAGWGELTTLDFVPTATTDSALFASNSSLAGLILGVNSPVPFGTVGNGVTIGADITHTATDTFRFERDGVYRVSYTLNTTALSVLGRTDVVVDGSVAYAGPTLVVAGAPVTAEVLVDANKNDLMQVVVRGLGLGLSSGTNATINIELVAAN